MNLIEKVKEVVRGRKLRKEMKSAVQRLRIQWNYRRDVMSEEDRSQVLGALDALAAARKSGGIEAEAAALERASSVVDDVVPKRACAGMRELTDTLVVAFGVAMAFRAYFFQPFKIPTGSMQPTLFGHHSEYCEHPTVWDAWPFKPFNWLLTGRWYYEIVAEDSGTLVVSADRKRAPGYVILHVAGKQHKVPQDAYDRGEIAREYAENAGLADAGGRFLATHRPVLTRGDRVWSGYSIAGDHVFVNRMKWYFRPPRRGDIVVFSTDGNPNLPPGEFYIKRLVGLPGETISVEEPYLVCNGEKVTDPLPFRRLAEKREAWKGGPRYLGYCFAGGEYFPSAFNGGAPTRTLLGVPGDKAALGPEDYLPMGDNTKNSYDGRYWGTVPRKRLLGSAGCVYWPLSVRWGRADFYHDEPADNP